MVKMVTLGLDLSDMTEAQAEVVELTHTRRWVSAAVIAEVLGVHPRTIQRRSAIGDLPFPYVQLGREFRYPLGPFNRWLVDHGDEPISDEDVEALLAARRARNYNAS